MPLHEPEHTDMQLTRPPIVLTLLGVALSSGVVGAQRTDSVTSHPSVLMKEFIADQPPTPSAHASTIVEVPGGLVAAWFGGTREGAPDVEIWLARSTAGRWSPPVVVGTGVQADGTRFPCYNPVLFYSADGVLHLFYKVGPRPSKWWGMHRASRDDGRTWSDAVRLPEGILGPVKNKPLVLPNGTIIAGSSTESTDSVSIWRVHFEISRDNARTWRLVMPSSPTTDTELNAIQPSILVHRDGRLQAVGRTRSARIFETWSTDSGATWGPLTLTALPNPNAGTDALTLRDGRQLIVYNNTPRGRTPLNVAVSPDGKTWNSVLVLEDAPGEYSYPAVIQTRDGLVHITYTWQRQRVRHVVLDPARLGDAH
ncbi:MAG: sialidase family protein [Gemmatimonadota bacterium]